jgi:hypothetical protein
MNTISLYDVLDAQNQLEEIDEEGAFTEIIETQKQEIVDYNIKTIKEVEAIVEGAERESKRLAEYAKFLNRRIDSRKAWLAYSLSANGQKEALGTLGRLTVRNTESVKVTNEIYLQQEFLKEKVTIQVDKVAIKKSLKEGKEVPGAMLVVKQSLQIK